MAYRATCSFCKREDCPGESGAFLSQCWMGPDITLPLSSAGCEPIYLSQNAGYSGNIRETHTDACNHRRALAGNAKAEHKLSSLTEHSVSAYAQPVCLMSSALPCSTWKKGLVHVHRAGATAKHFIGRDLRPFGTRIAKMPQPTLYTTYIKVPFFWTRCNTWAFQGLPWLAMAAGEVSTDIFVILLQMHAQSRGTAVVTMVDYSFACGLGSFCVKLPSTDVVVIPQRYPLCGHVSDPFAGK